MPSNWKNTIAFTGVWVSGGPRLHGIWSAKVFKRSHTNHRPNLREREKHTQKNQLNRKIYAAASHKILHFSSFSTANAMGFNKFISQQQQHNSAKRASKRGIIARTTFHWYFSVSSVLQLALHIFNSIHFYHWKRDKAPALTGIWSPFFPFLSRFSFAMCVCAIWKHAFLFCLRTFLPLLLVLRFFGKESKWRAFASCLFKTFCSVYFAL